MRNAWKKVMAVMLTVVLVLGTIPVLRGAELSADAETVVLGRTTMSSVNVRKSASTASDYWLRLPLGYVCYVLEQTSKKDGVWYKVKAVNPYSDSGRTIEGYILGNCLEILSEAETAEWLANPTQPNQSPTPTGGFSTDTPTGQITSSGVNFRVGPSLKAGTQGKLDRGMVVELLAIPALNDPDPWYYIKYDGKVGYIQGPFLAVINRGNLIPGGGTVTATPRPDVTPVPGTETPTPTAIVTPVPVVLGHVKTTKSDVNLRQNPAGTVLKRVGKDQIYPYTEYTVLKQYTWYYVEADGLRGWLRSDCLEIWADPVYSPTPVPTSAPIITATPAPTTTALYVQTIVNKINFRRSPDGSVIKQVNKDLLLLVTGTPVVKGKYTWYPVVIDGAAGYLRSDVVKVTQEGEIVTPPAVETPTPAPTATQVVPVDSGHLITIKTGVNLRTAASKDASSKVQVKMGTVMPYTATTVSAGQTWYKITYEGTPLWVMGSCIRVMSQAEYEEYIAGTVTPTPGPIVLQGYVKTTTSGLNVRSTANGSKIIGRISAKGTVVKYYNTQKVGTTIWYYVESPDGLGWINGTYVKITDEHGNPVGTNTPTPVPTVTPTPTYSTLKLGSTGPEVTRLVTALKAQGYYTGDITDTFTSAVKKAVEAFQRAKGMTVDGIAGPTTQELLYGGVNPDDNYMKLYKPEKIDWYTGGIQEMLPKGENFQIYDVYTGLVWWAHRWAGGDHADIEPLTAADTAKVCQMYGVTNAAEIASKDLWQRRPSLVTVNGHTYACSLYGEPHGTQTITTNNFPGQCCLHFTNSRTHGSQKVDSYHAAAIQYAIDHAPAPN